MRTAQVARKRLKGHWKRAVAAEILPTVTVSALTAVEWLLWRRYGGGWWWFAAALVADGLLCAPLQLGRARFFARLAAGQPPRWEAFAVFFRKAGYRRALRWWFGLVWRSALVAALCGLPAAGMTAVCRRLMQNTANDAQIAALFSQGLSVWIWLMAVLGYTMWRARQMLVTYRAATEETTLSRVFVEARRQWRGHFDTFVTRMARFTGWGILCVLLLPYGYAAPLFRTTASLWLSEIPPAEQRETAAKHQKKRALST